MSTDLARYEATSPAPMALRDYQSDAVRRLGEWAESASAAFQIAERLVQTSFVPAAFRGKPVEAAAAILAGVEVGLQPMAALRSFDVISGQAAARAITLRAIVQSHGHEIEVIESTATRCVMRGRRHGASDWQKVTWTIDRARDLQLTGKDNWKKQPIAMLLARATSEIARLVAADAILGIGYSAEEVADGATPDAVATTTEEAAPTGTRRMSRRSTPQTDGGEYPVEDAASPPLTSEEQGIPEPDSPPSPITAAQMKALHAGLNAAGVSDRASGLAYISEEVGRTVTTSKDLTRDEASRVIDALRALSLSVPEERLPWEE